MKLETFLYNLHFDLDKITQLGWKVDWEDAPFAYKVYRGLPEFLLSPNVPLTLKGREASIRPDLDGVGHFLWYVYGLSQF